VLGRAPAPDVCVAVLLAWLAGSGCQLAVDFDRTRIAPAPDAAIPDGGVGGTGGTTGAMAGTGGAGDAGPDAGSPPAAP
jgi:hypothetical protein